MIIYNENVDNNFYFFADNNEFPCVHGNCTNDVNMHSCECQSGFTGVNCDAGIASMLFNKNI